LIAVAEAMALPNVKLSPEASGVSSVGVLPEPSAAEFQFAAVNQFASLPLPVQYQVVAACAMPATNAVAIKDAIFVFILFFLSLKLAVSG